MREPISIFVPFVGANPNPNRGLARMQGRHSNSAHLWAPEKAGMRQPIPSTINVVRKKISSTCPCVVPLKHAVAMREQENMPCARPIPGCIATPPVLKMKTHLARCHPTVAPNTVNLMEWVVVSQDDEKGRGRAKKKSQCS